MIPPIPLVLDCDPGVDDAWCLALALASPELDVLAVTTVAGNATVDVTSTNASAVLAACGRSDIPVAVGAQRALVHAYDHGLPPPHGANGVGGVSIASPTVPPTDEHAVYLLRDILAGAAPQSVTVAATAPLTNIALLAALHPELLDRIHRVVVMGGSTTRGNITPSAEFNTWTDPESAQRVLCEPALDVGLVGLDVTRRATVLPEHADAVRGRSPLGALLADMLAGYLDRGAEGWAVHDALVVASLVDPEVLTWQEASVEVDTGTGLTRGQTVVEFVAAAEVRAVGRNRYTSAGRIQVAVDVDVERFRRVLVDRIAPT